MVGRTGEDVPLDTDDAEGTVGLAVAVLLEDDPFAPADLKNERGGILLCFPLLSRVRRLCEGFRMQRPFTQASCSFKVMVVLADSCVSLFDCDCDCDCECECECECECSDSYIIAFGTKQVVLVWVCCLTTR